MMSGAGDNYPSAKLREPWYRRLGRPEVRARVATVSAWVAGWGVFLAGFVLPWPGDIAGDLEVTDIYSPVVQCVALYTFIANLVAVIWALRARRTLALVEVAKSTVGTLWLAGIGFIGSILLLIYSGMMYLAFV